MRNQNDSKTQPKQVLFTDGLGEGEGDGLGEGEGDGLGEGEGDGLGEGEGLLLLSPLLVQLLQLPLVQ